MPFCSRSSAMSRRDPEAGGGVFAVGDHQVDLALRDEVGQAVANDLPARRTNDVSDEKNAHG